MKIDPSLEEYRRKRSFEITPEPTDAPDRSPSGRRRFCLQRHDATRLHYDFRLELDGVLKSWAVPKGPSLVPGEKRLAVPTEDHPLSYLDWEGTIPAGQYGGGEVMVFDIGDWEPVDEKDPEKSLKDGELKIRLWGQKIQGEWTLVRTRQRSWLLLKRPDAWVDPEWDPEAHLWSAVSGRTWQEVSEGREAPAPRKRFPRGAVKAPLPIEVQPMLARVSAPFSDPDWLYEVKWDGIRALAFCQEQSLRITSRAGNSLTESFPELRFLRSMLPHLADRPLSLRRYPDGVDGPEFFQKHPGNGVPGWIRVESTEHGQALMADNRATLTVLANLAAVELHVTMSRFPHLEVPDGIMIDFDPQQIAFPQVKKVAISAGELLAELGWTSYLKTSGGRGLHVFIPIASGYTFEQTRLLAGVIGEFLFKIHPKKVTLERVPAKRPKNTVYIDAPQNRITSTMACVYSVRANSFGGVSMPLRWEDLKTDMMPQDFNLAYAAEQAPRTKSWWSMQPDEGQRLEDVLPRLDERLRQ